MTKVFNFARFESRFEVLAPCQEATNKILPNNNRVLILATNGHSWHGCAVFKDIKVAL